MPVYSQGAPYSNFAVGDALRLYLGMRSAWDEHVQLTRTVIISFAGGLGDFEVAKSRLLASSATIAQAMAPYVPGQYLGPVHSLLVEHLKGSVPVLQAAKSGDQAALTAAVAAWRQNGSQLAQALSQATGAPYQTLNALVQKHLDTTIAEANERLKGDWMGDVAAYDAVRAHALFMADQLSNAIAKNQPSKIY